MPGAKQSKLGRCTADGVAGGWRPGWHWGSLKRVAREVGKLEALAHWPEWRRQGGGSGVWRPAMEGKRGNGGADVGERIRGEHELEMDQ